MATDELLHAALLQLALALLPLAHLEGGKRLAKDLKHMSRVPDVAEP